MREAKPAAAVLQVEGMSSACQSPPVSTAYRNRGVPRASQNRRKQNSAKPQPKSELVTVAVQGEGEAVSRNSKGKGPTKVMVVWREKTLAVDD